MLNINAKKIISTLSVLLFVWIMFIDPLGIRTVEQSMIPSITQAINSLMYNIRLDYSFNESGVITGVIFVKYLVLGILLMWMTSSYTMRVIQNIAVPTLLGLFISIGVNYLKPVYGSSGAVYDVIMAFLGMASGFAIFILIYLIKSRGKASVRSKYKTSKYKRR